MNSKSNNKCLNIQPLLYAYVDNELTDEQFDEVSSHLSECAHCRNTIANIYKVKDMVKMSYMPKEEVDFSKKIMANIQFNNKYSEKSKVKVNKSYGKVSSISKSSIKKTSILLPPLKEQANIVKIISDMDSLIFSIQNLINKKKAIRQGEDKERKDKKR